MNKTIVVHIGNCKIGKNQPIRVQSMTNTDTLNIESTLNQIILLAKTGCEIIRITVPGLSEVKSLNEIYQRFRALGYSQPLVADVHFNPKVAEEIAKTVEKVRINPGNYVDKKQTILKTYTEVEYQEELDRIAFRLKPLIEICIKHNTVIRIGVNHGSLSDRIIHKYGNTAMGMAMSAFEFSKIFHDEGFHNIVLSLKSSDVKTMVYATRLFVKMMHKNSMFYPIHLGVTEAGEGEDGRIKSAVGIGTLLLNEIGNTVRVSLTESPEKEIPVAKSIIAIAEDLKIKNPKKYFSKTIHFKRRKSKIVKNIGGDNHVAILNQEFCSNESNSIMYNSEIEATRKFEDKIIIFVLSTDNYITDLYRFVQNKNNLNPIIISKEYTETNINEYMLKASIEFGSLLIEGIIDGIRISNSNFSKEVNITLAENILQACGIRHFKAEIVSCPSCGRTQFNIEKLLTEVKSAVSHLKDLKIGVMGCVVNGPGEMADADYGLVGAGKNKVWLYKGQNVIQKNIEQNEALDVLIQFLKTENKWSDKNISSTNT